MSQQKKTSNILWLVFFLSFLMNLRMEAEQFIISQGGEYFLPPEFVSTQTMRPTDTVYILRERVLNDSVFVKAVAPNTQIYLNFGMPLGHPQVGESLQRVFLFKSALLACMLDQH